MVMYTIFSMYAISASTFLFSKQVLLYSSPLFLSGIRTLLGGTVLLLYARYCKRCVWDFKKLLFPCLGIAVYSFFLSNILKFWAVQHTAAAHAAVIFLIEPLFVIVLAFCMFNERMTRTKWFGTALCMGSGLMLAQRQMYVLRGCDIVSWPSFFLCIAVASSAYGALLMRKLIKYEQASPTVVIGLSMAIAGILALAATFTEVSSCTVTAEAFMPFMGSLIAMVVLSNIIAYSFYGLIITRYSALLISCGSFVRSFFSMLYGAVFFNEIVSWHAMGCAAILFIGLFVLYRDERAFVWDGAKSF